MFWLGAIAIVVTNLFMLMVVLPEDGQTAYALVNLASAGLMVFSKI